jgi:hypothetical protein
VDYTRSFRLNIITSFLKGHSRRQIGCFSQKGQNLVSHNSDTHTKVTLLKGREGPMGEFRYSCNPYSTLALDGGGWTNATSQPLYPQETGLVPTVEVSDWAPGHAWTNAENLAPTGI